MVAGSESCPMSDDRWLRVKRLFQAALERSPSERSAFVTAAVAGDDTSARADADNDGVANDEDNCILVANPGQHRRIVQQLPDAIAWRAEQGRLLDAIGAAGHRQPPSCP